MINVHRIYFGHSWSAGGLDGDLVRLLDAASGLLYAGCTLAIEGRDAGFGDAERRYAALKIAMAQCHVAVLWGGINDPAAEWTLCEARVARTAFRRGIPIIAVVPRGADRSAERTQLADRVVGWSADDAARAVVELAEMAAENRHLGRDASPLRKPSTALHPAQPSVMISEGVERRPLPVGDIVAAYSDLKAIRDDDLPRGSSM